jgi:competence protein ComEA
MRVPEALGIVALVAALVGGAVSAQSGGSNASSLPEGAGRAALLKACAECHGAESAVAHLKTRDEWRRTLDDMAANGAAATDEEWTQILDYLDTHFSLIFVNRADASELAKTFDVPTSAAEAVVRYREQHGPFASVDDVKKVPELGSEKVESRKDRLVFRQ